MSTPLDLRTKLSKSISLLSGLLQKTSQSESSYHLPDKPPREWRLLQSITTLLTTGDPFTDRADSRVVAATYSITDTHVNALIARNSRPEDIENGVHGPTVSPIVEGPDLDDEQVRQLLHNWITLKREDHDRNLFLFLNFMRHVGKATAIDDMSFLLYTLSMCYPKMLARLKLGENPRILFARSPMSVFKEHATDLTPSDACQWPWVLKTSRPGGLETWHEIYPNAEGVFQVDQTNIERYINIMVDAYTELRSLLRIIDEKQGEKLTLDERELAFLKVTFKVEVLDTLFSMEFVEHLLSDGRVLQKIILPRDNDTDTSEGEESSGHSNIDQGPSSDDQQSMSHSSEEDNEEPSLKRTSDETAAVHVARYLKSVVVWHRACAVAKTLPRPIRAHRVLFPLQVTQKELHDVYSALEKRILSHPRLLSQNATDSGYVADLRKRRDSFLRDTQARSGKVNYIGLPVLHAEAALVALAHNIKGANDLEILPHEGKHVVNVVFQDAITRIGVPNKCCWCCWKLGSILNATSNETNIELPGCHSIIFPWFPPPHLPIPVLQTMEEELTKLVVAKLVQNKTQALSDQSSTRSSGDSAPYSEKTGLSIKEQLRIVEEEISMQKKQAEIGDA